MHLFYALAKITQSLFSIGWDCNDYWFWCHESIEQDAIQKSGWCKILDSTANQCMHQILVNYVCSQFYSVFFLDMQNKIGLLFCCEITTCAFEHWLLSRRTNLSCHFTQTSHSSSRIVSFWNMCQGAYGNCRNTSPDPRLLCHSKYFLCILSLPLLSAISALGIMIKELLTAFFTPADCHVIMTLQ